MGTYEITSGSYSMRRAALSEVYTKLDTIRKLESDSGREVRVTDFIITEIKGDFSAVAKYDVLKENRVVDKRGNESETIFGESKDTRADAVSSLEQKVAELGKDLSKTPIAIDEDVLHSKFLAYAHVKNH